MGEFGDAIRNSYAAIASPFHANLHTSAELAQMQRTGVDIDPAIAEERAAQGALMRGRGLVASLLHSGMKLGRVTASGIRSGGRPPSSITQTSPWRL